MTEFVEVKTAELEGAALDWAVMTVEGFKLVRVGYAGMGPDELDEFIETPEQADMPEWFDEATDNSVGAYWVRESDRQVFEAFWPGYVKPYDTPVSPSTDWSQGGPLIEKHQLDLTFERKGLVYAYQCKDDGLPIIVTEDAYGSFGPTHLIAACRAIVASVLGDTVQVPQELV